MSMATAPAFRPRGCVLELLLEIDQAALRSGSARAACAPDHAWSAGPARPTTAALPCRRPPWSSSTRVSIAPDGSSTSGLFSTVSSMLGRRALPGVEALLPLVPAEHLVSLSTRLEPTKRRSAGGEIVVRSRRPARWRGPPRRSTRRRSTTWRRTTCCAADRGLDGDGGAHAQRLREGEVGQARAGPRVDADLVGVAARVGQAAQRAVRHDADGRSTGAGLEREAEERDRRRGRRAASCPRRAPPASRRGRGARAPSRRAGRCPRRRR